MLRLKTNYPVILNVNEFLKSWFPTAKIAGTGTNPPAITNKQVAMSIGDQPWAFYIFMSTVVMQSALIILNNTPQMSPWLLALLIIGVGVSLLLPRILAGLGGFIAVILWIMVRQTSGIWADIHPASNFLEMAGLVTSIILAIRFRLLWQHQQEEMQSLRSLHNMIKGDEDNSGLLPMAVAELRLIEETNRAKIFRRPLGLLLIEYSSQSKQTLSMTDFRALEKAITRKLASSSVHDIPFRMAQSAIGLIMPERTWEELYKAADEIVAALRDSSFFDQHGQSQPIGDYVRIDVGLATYQGESEATVDMIKAAKDSLYIGRQLTDLGAKAISAFAMPASPIVDRAIEVSL